MQRLISAICAGLILGTGLVLAFAQPADDAQQKLQGTWTATKAERDGNAADDVIGHRALLYRQPLPDPVQGRQAPLRGNRPGEPEREAVGDRLRAHGRGPKGEDLEGHLCSGRRYAYDLRQRTEPGRGSARFVETKSGSGYELITFKRAAPNRA